MNLIYVDLYQAPKNLLHLITRRPQRWRWKALNGDNFRVLSVGSERYTNKQDCIDAIVELFGADTDAYLRQHEQGNQALRLATPQAE